MKENVFVVVFYLCEMTLEHHDKTKAIKNNKISACLCWEEYDKAD